MAPSDHRVPRAQARREISLLLAVVAVAVGTVLTLGWWIGILERLDVLGALAILGAGGVVLVESRRRRGAGWTIARGLLIALAIVVVVVAAWFGACVASQCFN